VTLQNGLIHNGKAYLWTDTALWEAETGKRIGDVAKAFTGLEWPWAAVLSGTSLPQDPFRVQAMIGAAYPASPADLIEVTRDALRREAIEGRMCRVLLAYPCPTYGARMFHIAADSWPGRVAFEPFETIEYMSSGNGSLWAAQFAGRDLTPREMRRFIDYQIADPGESVHGWPSRLGGNLIETKVSAAGVKSRVVREIDGAAAEAA
jgi:hypothetical protein